MATLSGALGVYHRCALAASKDCSLQLLVQEGFKGYVLSLWTNDSLNGPTAGTGHLLACCARFPGQGCRSDMRNTTRKLTTTFNGVLLKDNPFLLLTSPVVSVK